MELYVSDDELSEREAQLMLQSDDLVEHDYLVRLAWDLRQRDSNRALKVLAVLASQNLSISAQSRLALVRAEIAALRGDLALAEQAYQFALSQFETLQDPLGLGDCALCSAHLAVEFGDSQRESECCQLARDYYARAGDNARWQLAQAWHIYELAFYQPEQALSLYQEFISSQPDITNPAVNAHLLAALGVIYGRREPGRASGYYLQSSELAKTSGLLRLAIISAGNAGETMKNIGDLEHAAKIFEWAAQTAQENQWPALIAYTMSQLGNLLRQQGQLERSQHTLEMAIAGFSNTPGGINKAIAYAELAECLVARHAYAQALPYFETALELFSQSRCGDGYSEALMRYARALAFTGAAEQALRALLQAEQLIDQHHYAGLKILLNQVYAEIHAAGIAISQPELQAPNPVLHYLLAALAIGDATAGWFAGSELYLLLAHAWEEQGELAQALHYTRLALAAEQTESARQTRHRTSLAQIRHETELIRSEAEQQKHIAKAESRRASELQEASATLERLSKIGQEITSNRETEAVFLAIHEHVGQLLDTATFIIYQLTADGQTLQQSFGIEDGQPHPYHEVRLDNEQAFTARCVRERCDLLIEVSPEHNPNHVEGTLYTQSMLFAPLIVSERLLGVMSIQSLQARAYGERERMIFRSLCAYSAIALDNAHAYRELRLTQQQLQLASETERQARERAELATRLKSEFLANMSHEIRTPMNAVIGLAHLALQTELSAKQFDYLNKIHKAGTSLLGIINDILDFSKIEAGMLHTELTSFSLNEVFANVSAVSAQKAAEKQVRYRQILPDHLPPYLLGDPLRLGQVLINLVNNAVKFTKPGGAVVLSVKAETLPGSGLILHFSVQDSGIGMSAEQQKSLFQPFTQADGSTTRKYGGTGLGLSISHRLVELMGGQLHVTSAPEQGSDFTFSLRVDIAHSQPAGHASAAQARLCLVSADAELSQLWQDYAEELQLNFRHFTRATDFLAALEREKSQKFADLVVFDGRHEPGNLLTLTYLLKHDPEITELPLLYWLGQALSGKAMHSVDGYLSLDCDASHLAEILQLRPETARQAPQHLAQVPQHTGHHVLLAEDNPVNQQITLELLHLAGISADVAENGADALQLIRRARPGYYSLILMDLQMPIMDGHEAVRQIRQQTAWQTTPIVALTAHAMGDIRERCLQEGMQDYLTKPLQPELLYQLLGRWLNPELAKITIAAADAAAMAGPALPQFTQLDSQLALHYMGGQLDLLLNSLHRFLQNQASTNAQLHIAIAQADWDLAQRLVHTCKGLAGSIGAQHLQQKALQLEQSLLAEPIDSKQLQADLVQFTEALNLVLDDLQTQLQQHPAPALNVDATSLEVREFLTQLGELLEHSDADALSFFAQHQQCLNGLWPETLLRSLKRYIDNYEFDSALKLIQQAP